MAPPLVPQRSLSGRGVCRDLREWRGSLRGPEGAGGLSPTEGKGLTCGETPSDSGGRAAIPAGFSRFLTDGNLLLLLPLHLQLLSPTMLIRGLRSSIRSCRPGRFEDTRNLSLSFPVRLRALSRLVKMGISRRNFESRLKSMTENLKPALNL